MPLRVNAQQIVEAMQRTLRMCVSKQARDVDSRQPAGRWKLQLMLARAGRALTRAAAHSARQALLGLATWRLA